ncbi:hypothetical protein CHARACLAT_033133 [Characodon lateralis]|uniref:Ig-like domain-containing protein n=1 Tax=Characodon lateralis TaxID=208331 RepID=A0ABU7ER44_9TELE|nr:hypothetical protein [Characodon lateralis]
MFNYTFKLYCVFVSAAETSGGELHLYHRAGDDVVLPCRSPSSSYTCSNVNWFYTRDKNTNFPLEVKDGKVVESSPRAARLNVDSDCSLIINKINAEDAGGYFCGYSMMTVCF